MSNWAKYWAIDLHVHTPGSSDANAKAFGSPDAIVKAAIDAGLHAIAITDHNTTSWCASVAAAAKSSDLIVLPGVEISTSEGHLLAIWEEGTAVTVINDVLARCGIGHKDHGKLNVATDVGLAGAAEYVAASGGLAIPAHIDRPKGLMSLAVRAQLYKTLLSQSLSAVEIVKTETEAEVLAKVQGKRILACVRGSDTWDQATSAHSLSGIGARRTWVKASRPDLVGLRHALADPELRVRLTQPADPAYPVLEQIEIVGGFLGGQQISLSPDLNCLLGGTGVGKSLILEAIRYALKQQLDRSAFPKLWEEIQSRLLAALTETGVVKLKVTAGGHHYSIERPFSQDGSSPAIVLQQFADGWAQIDVEPNELLAIAAFSQGEILEYSREPVGRMALVDTAIDLRDITANIVDLTQSLTVNAQELIKARENVRSLAKIAATKDQISDQVQELASLFDTTVVKQQEGWKREDTLLKNVRADLHNMVVPEYEVPALLAAEITNNAALFATATTILANLDVSLKKGVSEMENNIKTALGALETVSQHWDSRFQAFKTQLDAQLEAVNPGASLTTLRSRLEDLQAKLLEASKAKTDLENVAQPKLGATLARREEMMNQLHETRKARRELRRKRVAALNSKTAGFVKLNVPGIGNPSEFRAALNGIKVGSRVREEVLDAIARTVHPLEFVRALWDGDVNRLVNTKDGIDATNVARLLTNIHDRKLWEMLLAIQVIDLPDMLTIKFKKPDDGKYALIEELAHGQRCTAILVILLADGNTPVLVDQPEDALHAPWIEDYLVDRLRSLRGTRQYVFATRSPGIVVSGDAEQIVTMKATVGHGEVEALGSLERHDLNKLALHHLEGGPIAFNRRTRKLAVSTQT